MSRKNTALAIWLGLPVVIVALLCWAIVVSIEQRGKQREMNPPVGAGAGDTGGVNAIGEMLAGNKANHGAKAQESDQVAPPPATPGQVMVQPEELDQGYILIVEDKAKLAGPSSPIYLAGTVTGWNPGDPRWKLEPQSDMKWRIHVPASANRRPIEFKFTRGSWDLEELTSEMKTPPNRTLPKIDASALKPGEPPKIELSVAHWGDERKGFEARNASDPYRSIVATGTLTRLPVQGGAGTATGAMRELLVWLPPGYHDPRNSQATYPVLYLHDGQNLFEKLPQVPGEWSADETADGLIRSGAMRPVIIVGIPHSGAGRISEYLPTPALKDVPVQGDAHVDWLVNEVKPRVERAFRVRTGPESTGVGGSSLGAAISLHAANRYPEVFGLVLAESLPLRSGDAGAWDQWLASMQHWPRRVFLGMGGAETGPEPEKASRNQTYVDAVKALDATLKGAGLGPDRRLLVIDPAATHTEAAWAKRLPQALTFLFPPPLDNSK